MAAGYYWVISLFCFGAVFAALPEEWGVCKRASPKYEDCTKKQLTKAIASLKNGSKKLGALPLEPLRFETMSVNQGTGPVSINLQLKDVDFKGLSTARIIDLKNDLLKMTVQMHVERFVVEGTYTILGKVLVLPINGNGKCEMLWEDMKFQFNIEFEEIKKGGVTYYQVSNMTVGLDPKKLTVNFENLFNGNKELGDNMNRFLNTNWEEILNELKPAISRALGLGYKEYINRILARIPAREITGQ